jgi:transcriptional regulator with XRE-family HTH domain
LLRTLVGDVLRRHRLRQRRTLADVAVSARVSVQYLSEVERGRKEASSEVVAAVCAALHIDLSQLLADAGRNLAGDRATVLRLDLTGHPRPAPARGVRRPGETMLLAA